MEVVTEFLFLGSKITADGDCRHEIRRQLLLGRKATTNLDSVLKSRDISLPTEVHIVKAWSSLWSCTVERAGPWRRQSTKQLMPSTVVLEKTPESPLDSMEIKPVNLKGNQPWIFIGRTDAEAEAPVFWSSDVHRWLIGKVPDAGKDWEQKEKGVTEDEMAGWHHRLTWIWANSGKYQRKGSLACCSSWGCKVSDRT